MTSCVQQKYLAHGHLRLTDVQVHLDAVSSRNVSQEKVLDLRDVHGLFDGGVSAAHLQETTFQCVLTDHHSEKHSHLIIPKITRRRDKHGYILVHSQRNSVTVK